MFPGFVAIMKRICNIGVGKVGKRGKRRNKKNKSIKQNKAVQTIKKELPEIQNEVQTLEREIEKDKEQRRTTRLSAVIAIIAVVGTVCGFNFKLSINALNLWANQGFVYWYLQALIFLSLSTTLVLAYRLIVYVIDDLKRHNVADENYLKYDSKADESYNCLANDFKVYISLLIGISFVLLPLIYFDGNKKSRMIGIFGLIIVIFVLILFGVSTVKTYKGKLWSYIKIRIQKITIWLGICILCFIFAATFLINRDSEIRVEFFDNGEVEICNSSGESFGYCKLIIYDESEKIVYEKDIKKEELLYAKENEFMNEEKDGEKTVDVIVVNSERLHWKYLFSLDDVLSEEGKYLISVQVGKDETMVQVVNTIVKNAGDFTYAIDKVSKDY